MERTVLRLWVLATTGLALVLAGCGTATRDAGIGSATETTIGPPAHRSLSTPFPSPTPVTPSGDVLTAADTGATITLIVGQRVTVDLAPEPGVYAWDQPRLTGSGLRPESVTGGYPDRGPMRAVYLAAGPGRAALSSGSDAPCLHAQPRCSILQRIWTINVIVRPRT
jgi:hypothetical protein